MLRIGRTIRSAKMNEITPPKLMPPFHSTAASGTLPIEHTNDRIAIRPDGRPVHHEVVADGRESPRRQDAPGTGRPGSRPSAGRRCMSISAWPSIERGELEADRGHLPATASRAQVPAEG